MPKINPKIAEDFEKFQIDLPNILKSYGIEKTYICKKTGISYTTFYRKIKQRSFTAGEIKKIIEAINIQ
ncbi:MAG: helix-turn-helix domain-containing protein [Candidatus Cyclobacteriaceae bacterium M3_2C_046]